MNEPLAIVTGASSGFGSHFSVEFAKRGFHVIAAMRDIGRSEYLLNLAKESGVFDKIEVRQLDVTNEQSIDAFSTWVADKGKVDVLINNAGYAGAGFVEEISMEEYRQQFETNFFGAVAVTKTVLPMMRMKGSGKIINISSISGRIGFPGLSPYTASKHALEGWSESLRFEIKPFGVDVILIEPGSFKTNIWTSGKVVSEKSQNPGSPYFEFMKKIEAYIAKGSDSMGDPLEAAKKVAEIAMIKNPSFRYPLGKGTGTTLLLKSLMRWNLWESIFIKRLNR